VIVNLTPAPEFAHATWAEWIADPGNDGLDDAVKLNILRDYIWRAAKDAHADDALIIKAEWLNKKLLALGVSANFSVTNSYTLRIPVSGFYSTQVSATDRGEAERLFRSTIGTGVRVGDPVIIGTAEFTSGPKDFASGALPDEAPGTVTATLEKLRETILLGVISGPKFCVPGANEVLESFGLAPVPERKKFTVTRRVGALASTTIEAYDEASALRVAQWRWDNRHTGFVVKEADLVTAGDFVAAED
jgi:hypothetical protein